MHPITEMFTKAKGGGRRTSKSGRLELLTAYLTFYFTFRALIQLTMFPAAPTEMLPVLFLGLMLNAGAVYAILKSKSYWPLVALCWLHFGAGIAYGFGIDSLMGLMAVISIHSTRSRYRRQDRPQVQAPAPPVVSSEEKRAA